MRAPETRDHYVPERSRNPFVGSFGGGRALSAMMLPLLSASPTASFGVLTTTGRRTGRRRRRCLRVIRRGDAAYIVSIGGERAAWVRNLRADPHVRLRIEGGTFSGVARDPRDAQEAQSAAATFRETVHPFDYVACSLHRRGRPTHAKIVELHRTWLRTGTLLVVDLGARER